MRLLSIRQANGDIKSFELSRESNLAPFDPGWCSVKWSKIDIVWSWLDCKNVMLCKGLCYKLITDITNGHRTVKICLCVIKLELHSNVCIYGKMIFRTIIVKKTYLVVLNHKIILLCRFNFTSNHQSLLMSIDHSFFINTPIFWLILNHLPKVWWSDIKKQSSSFQTASLSLDLGNLIKRHLPLPL